MIYTAVSRYRRIQLRGMGGEVLVSAGDYEKIARFRWYLAMKGKYSEYPYCLRYIRRADGTVFGRLMHRELFGLPSTRIARRILIDHRDGDGLNNIRHNLRVSTYAHNLINAGTSVGKLASRLKGVQSMGNSFGAYLSLGPSGRLYLGSGHDEVWIAKVYDAVVDHMYGDEFPQLNFPHLKPWYRTRKILNSLPDWKVDMIENRRIELEDELTWARSEADKYAREAMGY